MSKYFLTTTGKTNPVILNDLNLSYSHPTSHHDLLIDITLDKILSSDDLKFCVETNQILLKNETGKPINLHDITQTSSILAQTSSESNVDLSVYQNKNEKNQANGYAGIGSDNKIPDTLIKITNDYFLEVENRITGFELPADNATSILSFSPANEFTITPVGASFSFYVKGQKFTKTTAQSVTITLPSNYDTLNPNLQNYFTGTVLIYFDDSGTLQYKVNTPDSLYDTQKTPKELYSLYKDFCFVAVLQIVGLSATPLTNQTSWAMLFDRRYGLNAGTKEKYIIDYDPLNLPIVFTSGNTGTFTAINLGNATVVDGDIVRTFAYNNQPMQPIIIDNMLNVYATTGIPLIVGGTGNTPLIDQLQLDNPSFFYMYSLNSVPDGEFFNMFYFHCDCILYQTTGVGVFNETVVTTLGLTGTSTHLSTQDAMTARDEEFSILMSNVGKTVLGSNTVHNILPIGTEFLPIFTVIFQAQLGVGDLYGNAVIFADPLGRTYCPLKNLPLKLTQKQGYPVDLSIYEQIANKNVASGYLGLDSNIRVNAFMKLKPKSKYSVNYNNKISLILNSTGGVVYNTDPTLNAKLDTNSVLVTYACLTTNGATGYCSAINDSHLGNKFLMLGNGILYSRKIVSMNSLVSAKYVIITGNTWVTTNSGSLGGGNTSGFAFYYDEAVNSGKWQCITIISGIQTVYNTTITPVANQAIELVVIYNKTANSVSFFIDGILARTMSISALPTTTTYAQYVCVVATTTGANKIIQLLDSVFELDLS